MGDRIAQMILEQIKTPEVEEQADLDQTERGEKGFGSTGMNEIKNELETEKSGQKNETGKKEIGTVKENIVKSLVKDTVNDRGVKGAVVKDVESVKETEENDAGKSDQQSKQQSKFLKIKSETPGQPKRSKLKDCVESVPPKADNFSEENEEAGEAERTSFHGSGVGTERERPKCKAISSEYQSGTHGEEEKANHEGSWPQEKIFNRGRKGTGGVVWSGPRAKGKVAGDH